VKHIAIANPDIAPYGFAAKQVLERAGLSTVAPRLAQAESVRQALQFVQTGNAEAGFVARSVANVPEVSQIELDRGLYDPIMQYMGIVAHTANPAAAKQLADFLLSDKGQETLESFGFAPVRQTRQ
jgi:molybdate transport system substrate-binding protein